MPRHRSILSFVLGIVGLPAATAWAACIPVAGSAGVLHAGAIVLLGELHGTTESPPAVADLACLALEAGLGVTVGLELPQADQIEVEAFLASRSTPLARSRLLAGGFWQRDYQDGRTSEAMLDLHVRLRELALAGGRLRIVYLDDDSDPGRRDQAMAERLLAARAEAPQDLVIAMTGNLHTRVRAGFPPDPNRVPMGLLVARGAPDAEVVSLDLAYAAGSAWICQGSQAGDCSVVGLRGQDSLGDGIVLFPDPGSQPVDGQLHVGGITASLPAKAVEAAASSRDGRTPGT